MSKKPSRRRKAPPTKRRRITFRIVVEAQPMAVSYEPRWMGDMAMFEFRSPHRPPRRIPVSETGYRSHYASMEEVEAAKSPQDFALEEARAILRSMCQRREDPKQLPLFD
jgi:hypothetical protein